jgi:hypothetical protein
MKEVVINAAKVWGPETTLRDKLVDKINLEIEDKFPDVSDIVRRQTIKKFVKNFEE